MHFYKKEGDSVRQIKNSERNYECFGWWFPDLLIYDVIKPQRTAEHVLKDDKLDIDADLKAKKLASEESLTSGSQLDKAEPNPKVEGLEGKLTVRQTQAKEGKFKNKVTNSTPVAPLTVARSSIRSRRTKTSVNKNKGSIEESSPTRQQLATLINRDSPNHKQLAAVLNPESRTQTQLQILEKDFKASTPVIRNRKQILPKTSQNPDSAVNDGTVDQNGLSPIRQFVQLALSIEHDSDNELEEPRDRFLQVASGLSSKLQALEADTKQLRLDIITLQQDFQAQTTAVTKMTKEARQLGADIQDLRYLDDLIFLLQGQLDRITLRNWPFVLAHIGTQTDNPQELNLVV